MTIEWGTGFETLHQGLDVTLAKFERLGPVGYGYNIAGAVVHTGGCSFQNVAWGAVGWFGKNIVGTPSSYYAGGWFYSNGVCAGIRLVQNDGSYLYAVMENLSVSFKTAGFDTGASIVSIPTSVNYNVWRHIQIWGTIAPVGGRCIIKYDGVTVIDYTGNTKPGTGTYFSAVDWLVKTQSGGSYNSYIDDVWMGDAWEGDIRYDRLPPSADTATAQWTPNTGTVHYNRVNALSLPDSNNLSSSINGQLDIFDITDWNSTGKVIKLVNLGARGKKDVADGALINLHLLSGAADVTVQRPVTTVYESILPTTFLLNPDGNIPWTAAAVNALQVKIESVLP